MRAAQGKPVKGNLLETTASTKYFEVFVLRENLFAKDIIFAKGTKATKATKFTSSTKFNKFNNRIY
ncbi:8492_t:CDS:2 [Cetraspora pellucida]|uniref:8492_t:CDS:1 n=1 Tax=Cetraspora pellucida TaxID=1433469 RepID=A0A9N9DWX5_9GLOM|nr:8492_t:CDS:2 [Cetraspora pellucida]